jgi:ABC-type Fe3+/spermidine/putrescine transport system ATPase subunit
VMNHGRVEQVADPETVYDQPETTFVAGFIGVSNLMPAKVSAAGEVRLDQGPTLSAETSTLKVGERCHAVVRPEKLRIDAAEEVGAGNGRPAVEGIVESSLYLGTATQIAVDLGDGVRMTVLVPNASEAERRRLPGGGVRVGLSWDPENMHVVRESTPVIGHLSSEANGAAGDGEPETTMRGESDERH